jgi:hypothetical protein
MDSVMTSVATRLVSISPMFISTGLIEELIIQRQTDENGKVTTMDFNTQMVNSMKAKVTKQLQAHLKTCILQWIP